MKCWRIQVGSNAIKGELMLADGTKMFFCIESYNKHEELTVNDNHTWFSHLKLQDRCFIILQNLNILQTSHLAYHC